MVPESAARGHRRALVPPRIEPRLGTALFLFAVGATIAGFLTALVMDRAGLRRRTARFAAALVLLITLTTGIYPFFLYIEYASY